MLNSQKYAKHLASLLICLAIPFTAVAETRISGPFILENKSEGALELYGVIQGESYLAEMLLNPHAENPNNPHRWNNEAELMAQTNLQEVVMPDVNQSGLITRKDAPQQCLADLLGGGIVMWVDDEASCTVWKNGGAGLITSVISGKKPQLTYLPFNAYPGKLITHNPSSVVVVRTDLMQPVAP
nr:hypothetical protein [uncultured Pseudomonas sp.]